MTPRNFIVLDLETQKSFKEVGRGKLEKLKVSVVGVYEYLTGESATYEEKDLMVLEKKLQEAELIIGFNIRRFDMPVLAPYLFTSIERFPVLDLLDDIEKARGHRASLDSIAAPTLQRRKSGTGEDALMLFKENRMDELKRYCLDDVSITKEVYEFGCREGKILFTSTWDYKTYEVPVRWKEATEELARQTVSEKSDFPTSLF